VKYLPFVDLSVCRLFVLVVSVVQPELPDGRDWCGETRRWWRVWGEDSRAGLVSDEEWLFLMDAAVLHDVVWREGRADLVASLRAHVKAFMGMLEAHSGDAGTTVGGAGSAVAMIDRYRKRKGA
jgi:gp1